MKFQDLNRNDRILIISQLAGFCKDYDSELWRHKICDNDNWGELAYMFLYGKEVKKIDNSDVYWLPVQTRQDAHDIAKSVLSRIK